MDDEPVAGIQDALEEVQAFARAMCEDADDPGAMDRLVLRRTDTRLVFSVLDAESCGSVISGFLKAGRAHIMVRNCLNRLLRQRSRDRSIAESGETGTPAWSVDIHPATLSALLHAGVNPALAALLEDKVGIDNPLSRAAESGAYRIGDAKLIAGRVCVATMSGKGHPTDDMVNVYENTQRQQTVMIRQQLPDTVVADLSGRTLGEVTDHPMLAHALGVRIMGAQCNGDVLTLEMEDTRVTLATPPNGAPWLRFPWFTPAD